MARCGCGSVCGCALVAGAGITVTGGGSPANPWVVSTEIADCDDVRDCFEGSGSILYDPDVGQFEVCISALAPNNLTTDINGCLLVPPGNNAVVTGCGIDGTGIAGDPLRAEVSTWTFPCTLNATNAMGIYCDPANGTLRGEPKIHTYGETVVDNRTYPNIVVPAAVDAPADLFSATFTNPDPCRAMNLWIEQEVDVDLNLPPGGSAEYGHSTDATYKTSNEGNATTFNNHVQTSRVFLHATNVAPGANSTRNLTVTIGQGQGGATYNRIQVFLRAMWFPA